MIEMCSTVFGKVIKGFETLNVMERETNDEKDRPLNEIKLYKVEIHANPIAEKEQLWSCEIISIYWLKIKLF